MSRFDYDTMVQKALREVVRSALKEVQEKGLSGSHHFYITFQTNRNDVGLPDYLRKKNPEEITIVLQHQFWDLKVTEIYFQVTLSFNDKPEIVTVPYTAIISFLDPSVKFGLQFVPDAPTSVLAIEGASSEGSESDPSSKKTMSPSAGGPSDNVVTLDRFRKKP